MAVQFRSAFRDWKGPNRRLWEMEIPYQIEADFA